MPLDLSALDAQWDTPSPASGTPLQLPLSQIDEDPAQPRQEFDPQALQELASTIAERGVRQPISVRSHPAQPGRWLLNFGARRLRASRLAGRTDIPAFIDETADTYDQVIENEQRAPLQPLELAMFVARCLAAGDSQAEIARRIGKTRQYISLATALIDPPDWILAQYRSGRCRGLIEIAELRRLHHRHPEQVQTWAQDRELITRSDLLALKTLLNQPTVEPADPGLGPVAAPGIDAPTAPAPSTPPEHAPARSPGSAQRPRRPAARPLRLIGAGEGSQIEILLDRHPTSDDHVYVRAWPAHAADPAPWLMPLAQIQLLHIWTDEAG